MELRRYLAIIKAHWLLAGTTFVVTVLATLYFVMPQPWVYESTGSVRLKPSDRLQSRDDVIDAWSLLSEPKVPNTFAAAISSDFVIEQAELTLSPEADTESLDVSTQVLIDTSIIDVTVTGGDAATVQEMTTAVMNEGTRYVNGVDAIFQLEVVDAATLPGGPVGPNKNLQLVLGVIFGALLAIAIALFAEYIRRPVEDYAITDAITGASNELYLRHRLREETARTIRTNEPFTVATLRVEVRTGENDDMAHVPADRDLRRIARGLRLTVPDDSVLAYLGGGLFAALVPGIAASKIEGTVGGWAAAVGALLDWSSQGELSRRLQLTSGLCEFRGTTTSGSADVEKLVSKLIGEVSMEDLVSEAPASRGGTGGKAPAAKQAPPARAETTGSARPTDARPAAEPKPQAPARAPAKPSATKPRAPAEPKVPAERAAPDVPLPEMPPAPVSTEKKSDAGTNGRKTGNGNTTPRKKPVRRVTVLPDIDDMPPIDEDAPATAATPAGGTPPADKAGREKGDAGDPAG